MISWMQKHRKYLVITIWISTIAFVGAGFVGWGAYKFGQNANAIAKVGDTEISIKEFQKRYSRLYNYYNKVLNGKLDQQKAKEAGLDKIALNELIKEALLINYAKEHGLIVTDEEVAQAIAAMEAFHDKTGAFSKEVYLNVLKSNRMKPADFEESIRKELLIAKVKEALAPRLFDLERDTVGSSLFIGDKLKYLILSDENITVDHNESALREYYEKNRQNYLSDTKYKIALIEVKPDFNQEVNEKELLEFYKKNRLNYKDSEGKILTFKEAKDMVKKDYILKSGKKEALKTYIAFKKGKIGAQKELSLTQAEHPQIPDELFSRLESAQSGKIFKPIKAGESYLIVKMVEKTPPTPLEFQEARAVVEKEFLQKRRRDLLLQKAKSMVNNFQGKVTPGFITRDDVDKIEGLDSFKAAKFLKELFISKEPKGYIFVDENRVVLYNVLDQKLKMEEKIDKNRDLITDNAAKLKAKLQSDGVINRLEKIYKITIYKGL